MKITSTFKLSVALIALSSYVNAVTIFDIATGSAYPTSPASSFDGGAYDIYETNDTGTGNGWSSGITKNFNGASSAIDPGDQKTSGTVSNNNVNITTYFGPTVYAGMTRDAYKGAAGVIYTGGNGYRIRVNNVSQTDITNNGGDINLKAVFMFDAENADVYDYTFGASDTLVAQVATPNYMGAGDPTNSNEVKNRSSLATYRAMVKADGEYYAGTLRTIDLSLLSGQNSALHSFTENAASANWTLMDNMESSNGQLQGNTNAPQNLSVDGSTTVIGSSLTGITQVGFLLETSSQVQTGGYNYGVLEFSATAVPEPSSYALIAGLFALASIMVRRRQ